MEFKAIPSFAKSYKKEYAFLFGIDTLFGEILKLICFDYIPSYMIQKASKLATWIEKLIKEYKQGNGSLQDLNGKDVKEDVRYNINNVTECNGFYLGGFEYSLQDISDSIIIGLRLSGKKPNNKIKKSLLLIKLQRVINYYDNVFKYNIIDDLIDDLSDDEYDFSSYIGYDTESSDDEEDYEGLASFDALREASD